MKDWGITLKQAEEMVKQGKLKQTELNNIYDVSYVVYYQENPESLDSQAICAANNMGKFVFSEWMEFYRCRVDALREQCNITGVIPIITKEECIACGL